MICRALHRTSAGERIMLLGHGSDKGLFLHQDDSWDEFDRLIVYHPHAYYLRKHGGNMVGIWRHVIMFAEAKGLHGLFLGMIVTEMSEALLYGIEATQEELDCENLKIVQRLRRLFDEGVPLFDIPQRLVVMDGAHTPLTDFNYRNFYCL